LGTSSAFRGMHGRLLLLGSLLVPTAGFGQPPGQPQLSLPPRPSLAALRIDEPVKVDGLLDDAAWQQAAVGSEFIQREPHPGEPATETTEIRVVYTDSTLYVGIRALASEPEKIVGEEMQRDGALFRDDSVLVLLDTFNDDRNAYFFEVNPNGAFTDALVTDEGRDCSGTRCGGRWRSARPRAGRPRWRSPSPRCASIPPTTCGGSTSGG